MSLKELIKRVEASGKSRSHEKRMQLLRDAHILDNNGNLDQRFFSTPAVQAKISKRRVKS